VFTARLRYVLGNCVGNILFTITSACDAIALPFTCSLTALHVATSREHLLCRLVAKMPFEAVGTFFRLVTTELTTDLHCSCRAKSSLLPSNTSPLIPRVFKLRNFRVADVEMLLRRHATTTMKLILLRRGRDGIIVSLFGYNDRILAVQHTICQWLQKEPFK
jgi:hypothetical protein